MSKLEVKICGEKETMHCIRCGGDNFEENKIYSYEQETYRWYRCQKCGLEFRPNRKNYEDPEIYTEYGIVFVNGED